MTNDDLAKRFLQTSTKYMGMHTFGDYAYAVTNAAVIRVPIDSLSEEYRDEAVELPGYMRPTILPMFDHSDTPAVAMMEKWPTLGFDDGPVTICDALIAYRFVDFFSKAGAALVEGIKIKTNLEKGDDLPVTAIRIYPNEPANWQGVVLCMMP